MSEANAVDQSALLEALEALADVESKSTQGEWIVREHPQNLDYFFVERPRQGKEPYGVDVLGDEDYPTKRSDAEFVVAAKKLIRDFFPSNVKDEEPASAGFSPSICVCPAWARCNRVRVPCS